MYWLFYAVWRTARCLSRVLVVLCSVATSKVFITCNGCSMQCGDQQGFYHMYLFNAVSRSTSKAFITCTGRSVVSRLTKKAFITCTCSMQCLDQNVFSSHVLLVVSADSIPVRCLPLAQVALYSFSISKALATCTGRLLLCCVLRQHGGWRLFTLLDTNKQVKCITRSSPLCLHSG